MKFDIGKWHYKLLKVLNIYKSLSSFIADGTAFNNHVENTRVIRGSTSENIEETTISNIEEPAIKEQLSDSIRGNIDEALEMYSQQMIVLITSYIECMLSEFFFVYFNNYPSHMYNYIAPSVTKSYPGFVKLSEILKHSEMEQLISDLSERASKNASNGSLKDISKRIEKLTKYSIEGQLIDNLQNEVFNIRHKIIHEAKELILDTDTVEHALELAEDFLYNLGCICKEASVPYEDPGFLVDERSWPSIDD